MPVAVAVELAADPDLVDEANPLCTAVVALAVAPVTVPLELVATCTTELVLP